MHDRKTIRRRRAALAVFIALSIAILTAYFGESCGGFFHALQRGAQEAFAPIETGASRALKPLRDLVGWTGDTIDAKDQNEELRREVDRLTKEVAEARTAQRDAAQLKGLVGLQKARGLPAGHRAGGRARDRALAERLVLADQDRQGVERRHRRWISR